MGKINVGIVIIDENALLKILDFEGGTIIDVKTAFDEFIPGKILLKIEHPDMPDVNIGDPLQRIVPLYQEKTVEVEGELYRKVSRVDPVKKEKEGELAERFNAAVR